MVSARSASCLRTTVGHGPQRWPLSEAELQSQMSPAVERGEEGRGGRQIKSGENEGKKGGGRGGKGKEERREGKEGNKSLSGTCRAPGVQTLSSILQFSPTKPFSPHYDGNTLVPIFRRLTLSLRGVKEFPQAAERPVEEPRPVGSSDSRRALLHAHLTLRSRGARTYRQILARPAQAPASSGFPAPPCLDREALQAAGREARF